MQASDLNLTNANYLQLADKGFATTDAGTRVHLEDLSRPQINKMIDIVTQHMSLGNIPLDQEQRINNNIKSLIDNPDFKLTTLQKVKK